MPAQHTDTTPTSPWTSAIISFRDLVVVAAGLIAILVTALFAANRYSNVEASTTLLGVVLPSITAIIGAVFGLSLGATAGNAAGKADSKAETASANQKASHAEQSKTALQEATKALAPEVDRIQQAIAALEARTPEQPPASGISLQGRERADSLDTIKQQLAALYARIDTITGPLGQI